MKAEILSLAAALALITASWAATGGSLRLSVPDDSASPMNEGIWGTSLLVETLKSEGFHVEIGGPWDAWELASEGRNVIYMIIAPDFEPPPNYTRLLTAVAGSIEAVIIADEIGTANPILEALGAPTVTGPIVELAEAECLGSIITVPKVSSVESGVMARVLCTAGEGRPMASLVETRAGAKVLVIADSSIFTNFMIAGVEPYEPTAPLILSIIREAAPKADTIIIDNTLYKYRVTPGAAAIAEAVLKAQVKAVSVISREPWGPAVAALISLTIPLILYSVSGWRETGGRGG